MKRENTHQRLEGMNPQKVSIIIIEKIPTRQGRNFESPKAEIMALGLSFSDAGAIGTKRPELAKLAVGALLDSCGSHLAFSYEFMNNH